jgi:hypothetical protein
MAKLTGILVEIKPAAGEQVESWSGLAKDIWEI